MVEAKVIYIALLRCNDPPTFLLQHYKLSDLKFLARGTAKSIAVFAAREIASRIGSGENVIVHEDKFDILAHRWDSDVCAVCVCGHGYPERVAFSLLQLAFFEFIAQYPDAGVQYNTDVKLNVPQIKALFDKYRDPKLVDAYTNVADKLQNTISVVHKTLADMLQNEETLEALVTQSKDLSTRTKNVFSKSRKLKRRSCCVFM
ncbi:Synaptobrevin like YKT6 [Babesia ovata]|uniref:Synaptobrevin like YKT6 n=1 Tax=Babesia ovata TaxID=189622 RepID=A0A2H6KI28_9APIC|nr:Synaptobrevin like YKT6 [Babesia ovata]GBE62648.1 Synaptobrevin like YKT6 [Babesia ovata]